MSATRLDEKSIPNRARMSATPSTPHGALGGVEEVGWGQDREAERNDKHRKDTNKQIEPKEALAAPEGIRIS